MESGGGAAVAAAAAAVAAAAGAASSPQSFRNEAAAEGLKRVWSAKAIDAVGRHAQRRKDMLAKQKQQRRKAYLENVRQLASLEEEEQEEEREEMEVSSPSKAAPKRNQKRSQARKRSKARSRRKEDQEGLRRQLTVPEPLQELPDDLEEGWTGVAVPPGERCLVVAANSSTAARDMEGRLLERFASGLPNGAHLAKGKAGAVTLLDCVYHEESETFFVLDIICWKGTLYYECDAAFRRFWLQSRLAECPLLAGTSARNHYRFLPAATFGCSPAAIASVVQTLGQGQEAPGLPYPVETLLFYCNEGFYHLGETPLVLYLPVSHAAAALHAYCASK